MKTEGRQVSFLEDLRSSVEAGGKQASPIRSGLEVPEAVGTCRRPVPLPHVDGDWS